VRLVVRANGPARQRRRFIAVRVPLEGEGGEDSRSCGGVLGPVLGCRILCFDPFPGWGVRCMSEAGDVKIQLVGDCVSDELSVETKADDMSSNLTLLGH
jgi:hypothetical protein